MQNRFVKKAFFVVEIQNGLRTWKKRTQHLQNILQQRHWIIIFHHYLKQSQLNDVIHAHEMFRDLA